jgi:hypothetical protein
VLEINFFLSNKKTLKDGILSTLLPVSSNSAGVLFFNNLELIIRIQMNHTDTNPLKQCVNVFAFQSHFISALTVVFVNSKSLSSLKIDDTPVDDPSLKVLVANNSDTLKLLKMSSCPHVSPAGMSCLLPGTF